MGTTYSLRDLGIFAGQSKHENVVLELDPYHQAGVDYAPRSGRADADLDVTAMTEGASFRLRFHVDYDGPCARCLEPATLAIDVDDHEVHDENAEEEELRSDHVDDKLLELDISAWAHESIGLRFPVRVLCRKDCRGLCAECGVNLNEHPDHDHEKPTDSRWDALRQLAIEDEPS